VAHRLATDDGGDGGGRRHHLTARCCMGCRVIQLAERLNTASRRVPGNMGPSTCHPSAMPRPVVPAVMSAAATRQHSTARPPDTRSPKTRAAPCPQTAAQELRNPNSSQEGRRARPELSTEVLPTIGTALSVQIPSQPGKRRVPQSGITGERAVHHCSNGLNCRDMSRPGFLSSILLVSS
jgi:hypothetical protein